MTRAPRNVPQVMRAASVAVMAVATVLAGCGGGQGSAAHTRATSKLTVFAAASLSNAFTDEAKAFTADTGVRVTFSFAGSQELAAQIREGAPADVLATADMTTMQSALHGLTATPSTFARNRLVIVTAAGNPKHVTSLASLADPRLVVVLAGPAVPAGKYAARALTAAHVTVHPKSFEDSVRGVLTKVEFGEADAGVVYVTDAKTAGSRVSAVPVADSPVAAYPIVALQPGGRAFVEFILSEQGQAILRAAGFLPP